MARDYVSLSDAVDDLQRRGYVDDLRLGDECVICMGNNASLDPESFTIDEFHRFEGDSNPSDESIVYAISSVKYDVKGLLINAFGPEASGITQAMVSKLSTHRA